MNKEVFELSYVTGSYVTRVRGSWQAKDSIVGRVLCCMEREEMGEGGLNCSEMGTCVGSF